jgi:hypothetical protein
MKPDRCPKERGLRRAPDSRDKMMFAALFLFLAAVLLSTLAVGFVELNRAHRSSSAIGIPPPVARAVELMGQPSYYAR